MGLRSHEPHCVPVAMWRSGGAPNCPTGLWHSRQFMPGTWDAGWSGAVSCSGSSWWHTRHDSSREIGKWQFAQWVLGPRAHSPRWLIGAVSSWQRTQ